MNEIFFFLAVTAGAIWAGLIMAAEKTVDFGGTWIFDPAHSKIWHTSPNLYKPEALSGNRIPASRNDDEQSDAILWHRKKDEGMMRKDVPHLRCSFGRTGSPA